MQSGRIGPINAGIADIRRWRDSDEVHLPPGSMIRTPYVPEQRPLDAILRRETLEERLAGFIVPSQLSPELGEVGAIRAAREALQSRFRSFARRANGRGATALEAAASLLDHERALDDEVQIALAALLRA